MAIIPGVLNGGQTLFSPASAGTAGQVLRQSSTPGKLEFGEPLCILTPPVNGDFSWINQDGATISQSRLGVVMSATGAAGDMNARIRIKSLPATPYVITAAFQFLFDPNASSMKPAVGIVLRQSSDGKLVAFDVNHVGNVAGSAPTLNWRVAKWNSPTTSAPTAYAERSNMMPPGASLLWLRLADDGSNRKCWVSANGDDWIQFGSNIAGSHTDFMTADQVGWFINPYNSNIVATLVSWKES